MRNLLFIICLVFWLGCFEKKAANVGGTTVPVELLKKSDELTFDYTGLLDKAQRKDADALKQMLLFSKNLEDQSSADLHGAILREILAKTGDSFFAETIVSLADEDKNTAWTALENGASQNLKKFAPLAWNALLPTTGLKEYEGLLVFNTGNSTFRDCAEAEAIYYAVDETGELESNYRRVLPHSFPGQAIVAKVKGYKTEQFGLRTLPSNFAGFIIITEMLEQAEKNFRNTCVPYDYWALGTEPFWSAEISGQEAVIEFKGMDEESTRMFAYANPVEEDSIKVYAAVNQSTGDNIRVHIKNEKCSDGMSDREYSYSVSLTMNGKTFEGCAISFDEKDKNPEGEGQ